MKSEYIKFRIIFVLLGICILLIGFFGFFDDLCHYLLFDLFDLFFHDLFFHDLLDFNLLGFDLLDFDLLDFDLIFDLLFHGDGFSILLFGVILYTIMGGLLLIVGGLLFVVGIGGRVGGIGARKDQTKSGKDRDGGGDIVVFVLG